MAKRAIIPRAEREVVKQLGQLEAVVMQRLWAIPGSATVRDILEDLQRDRAIAYTTVMTVLDNLHTKGLVLRERDGRAWRYAAKLSREAHTAGLLDDVLAQSSDRGATLLNFVGHLSPDDIEQLRAALRNIAAED